MRPSGRSLFNTHAFIAATRASRVMKSICKASMPKNRFLSAEMGDDMEKYLRSDIQPAKNDECTATHRSDTIIITGRDSYAPHEIPAAELKEVGGINAA